MVTKLEKGFSIIEFLIGSIIVFIAAGSVMFGVTSIRKTTNLITVKEKAFEELTNYTDFWKSKIAAGEWAGTNSWTDAPIFDLIDNQDRPVRAILSKKGSPVNGDYPYPLYSLETKITWWDRIGEDEVPPRELNFKVYQIEFK
tara:strand:- start:66 stop:494 length:429 start_codon:yes stop_codon:yes gene_type:complete